MHCSLMRSFCTAEKIDFLKGSPYNKNRIIFCLMIRKTLLSLFSLALCFLGGITQAQSNIFIAVQNGVAGESISVRVSGLSAQEKQTFSLLRPDQTRIPFSLLADDFGVAETTIHNLHVQKSGIYSIQLEKNNQPFEKRFEIFPGSISSHTSDIQFNRYALAGDGQDFSQFEVTIRDAFGNPIQNTPVQIISSRNTDQIKINSKTNTKGTVTGNIRSNIPGVSSLSILAKNTVLFKKPQIVFYTVNKSIQNGGSSGDRSYGEYLRAQLFDDDTQVAYFTIENLKPEAFVNEMLSFTVVAKDINGETVPNYQGSVRFNSPGDMDSTLPHDYTFNLEDQGRHQFSIAVSFGTIGEQTLEVHDMDDFRIAGEATINIVLGSSPVEPPSNPALQIITPKPGKHQSSQLTITGKATDVQAIKIVDGQYTIVENLQIDDEGNFVFQTPRLGDGLHIFQAFDMYSDLSSNSVNVEIDTTPPNTITSYITPEGPLEPGQEFQVFVSADEPLTTVSVIYQDVLTQLIPNEDKYTRTLTAPLLPGEYTLDIIASDMLGNKVEKNNAVEVAVKEEEPFTPTPVETPEPPKPPSTITNLHAKSGDGKITLFWSPPSEGNIESYRIEFAETELFQTMENNEDEGDVGIVDDLFNSLYGEDNTEAPDLLPLIDTESNTTNETPIDPTTGEILLFSQFNETPDARTQWYVDNLQDDKKYFFRVIAIDANKQESPPSNILNELTQGAKQSLIPEKAPETGSDGSVVALLIGLIAGGFVFFSYRKRTH